MGEHKGDVIQAGDRVYAYQDEPVRQVLTLIARPAEWLLTKDMDRRERNPDYDKYSEYELTISRHTGNSLLVKLTKRLSGNELVRTRIANGAGTTEEVFTTTMSFAELANRLLGPGCQVFEETEAFPDSVKAAMKEAYQK